MVGVLVTNNHSMQEQSAKAFMFIMQKPAVRAMSSYSHSC